MIQCFFCALIILLIFEQTPKGGYNVINSGILFTYWAYDIKSVLIFSFYFLFPATD